MRITNKCRYLKGSVEEDRAALSLSLSLSLPDLDIEGTSFEKMGTAIDTTMDGCCCSRLTSVHALEVHFHEHAQLMHTGRYLYLANLSIT